MQRKFNDEPYKLIAETLNEKSANKYESDNKKKGKLVRKVKSDSNTWLIYVRDPTPTKKKSRKRP